VGNMNRSILLQNIVTVRWET